MKKHSQNMRVRSLTLAVEGAVFAMCLIPLTAVADDASNAEADALKRPHNYVEIGAMNVVHDSAKFGEYNGLDGSGVYAIGNVDVSGGNAYEDGDGTMRWQVKGINLGTTSRALSGTVENQGQWSIGIGFDELRHYLSDSYQTPFLGKMGGDNFALPTGFGTSTNTVTSLSAAQRAMFHNEEIDTTRKNTSISAGFRFDPQWDFKMDYNHLDQSGAKLKSFASMANGAISGEKVSILPDPTNYTTDTVNLALNWAGDKAHLTAAYAGSFFRDEYDRVTFQTFAGVGTQTQTMSTAPSNDFHQFSLSGGYKFTDKTKLAGSLSYGRNTQNDAFVADPMMNAGLSAFPRTSLDGKVITTHADLKLTDQSFKNLTLAAGVKYDERDNQTTSNIYNFHSLDGGHDANYPNTPLSNKKTQWELAGDYRLDNKQHIRLAYNREDVSRWCNSYAVNAGYPAGTNCVVATDSKDDKLSATYKLNATEDVHLNAGYSYSNRRTSNDQNAIAAFSGNQTLLAVPGLNGGDFIGFHPYFDGSRKQQTLKAGVDWNANDKLSLGLNGRYTDDDYDTTYGVQGGKTWSLNLDATFRYSENGSVTGYLTKEYRDRDLTSLYKVTTTGSGLRTPTPAPWANSLTDEDLTFGLGAKQGGLMSGKLALAADLTYSLGETSYSTTVPAGPVTTGGLTCSAPNLLQCGDLPNIKNRMTQLKLSGDYAVSKSGKIMLGYLYQRLSSNDYYYNGLQYLYSPTGLLPTNQLSGSYSVNVVSAAYIYSF